MINQYEGVNRSFHTFRGTAGTSSYGATIGWTQDFARAMGDRPLWARLLFRLAVGRLAYREFVGLLTELKSRGDALDCYSLDGQDYHKDKVPFDFGKVIQDD